MTTVLSALSPYSSMCYPSPLVVYFSPRFSPLLLVLFVSFFFFSSRRRHTRSLCDWSSDVCSSDLEHQARAIGDRRAAAVERVSGHRRRVLAINDDGREPCAGAGDREHHAVEPAARRSEERRVGKECRARWAAAQ